jgi:DNA mismatch repair protein MutS
MQVDKITLQDIGLFDNGENIGLASHLNFCKTNGGKAYLDSYFHTPLGSLTLIEQRQSALKSFIENMEQVDAMKISNGTCLIIEKFFETSFKTIPYQISYTGAYWYQFWNKADYSLLKYSVDHFVIFIQNLKGWVAVFEKINNNPVIEKLVSNISKLVANPKFATIDKHYKASEPQEVLNLAYFLIYHFKTHTRSLLDYFYDLDALYSLAKAHTNYQFEFPNWIEDTNPFLEVSEATHPLVHNAIGNDLILSTQKNFLFLTGANMAGKSTFIKTIGIVVYLSHIGIGAPAKKITLTVMDGLITNLNIADNVVKGESYFYNEVQRIKNTVLKINDGKKNCVLIDELFKGTNILDAMKCSTQVIEGLQKLRSSIFILSTHLYEISEGLTKYDNIQFSYFETSVKDKQLHFQYQLTPGISQDRIGYLILEREGVVDLLNAL